MPKNTGKGATRSKGRYIRGDVDESLTLAALASKDVVSDVFNETVEERARISSLEASYSLSELTATANAGPIMVGIAHSDYTAAEIEEFIENAGSWSEGDKIAQEIAKRLVRIIGIFSETGVGLSEFVLNDGKPIKTKLNWVLDTGATLKLWVYNLGTAAVATTTPVVHCFGHANLWYL